MAKYQIYDNTTEGIIAQLERDLTHHFDFTERGYGQFEKVTPIKEKSGEIGSLSLMETWLEKNTPKKVWRDGAGLISTADTKEGVFVHVWWETEDCVIRRKDRIDWREMWVNPDTNTEEQHINGDIDCPRPTHKVHDQDDSSVTWNACVDCRPDETPLSEWGYVERDEYGGKRYWIFTSITEKEKTMSDYARPEEERCIAVKKGDEQCNGGRQKGSKFCGSHQRENVLVPISVMKEVWKLATKHGDHDLADVIADIARNR